MFCAPVISLKDLCRCLTKDLDENLYGLFHQLWCKESHHISLSDLYGSLLCICSNTLYRHTPMQMLYERVSRLQAILTLAFVLNEDFDNLCQNSDCYNLSYLYPHNYIYEGLILWLIVLGSPGLPSVSYPRHALNLLGLMWLFHCFRGQRY